MNHNTNAPIQKEIHLPLTNHNKNNILLHSKSNEHVYYRGQAFSVHNQIATREQKSLHI